MAEKPIIRTMKLIIILNINNRKAELLNINDINNKFTAIGALNTFLDLILNLHRSNMK